MGKLTAKQVETLKAPGRHSDGNNLYLNINKSGAKSWVFFYRFDKTQREMGLGGLASTSLAQARVKALDALILLKEGRNPLAERLASQKTEASKISFGAFADDYIKTHQGKFRNEKHKTQWASTLGPAYLGQLRSMAIADVDTQAVLKVLHPLWGTVPETASRIRGRIENVLDAAKAQGLFTGENPARWKGHLKAVLPARQRISRGHHAALPYDSAPAFMAQLREVQNSLAAKALEFCILTATRTNETLGMVWTEVDLAKGVWIIPANRMKGGYEHRIPLPSKAIALLEAMEKFRSPKNPHVFPGRFGDKKLSHISMAQVLKRMGQSGITVHGFRSSFRDWASEQTSFPHETCEHALAHRISDKAEAAYRRGDQFEKRQKLMEGWAAFAYSKPMAKVLPMKR